MWKPRTSLRVAIAALGVFGIVFFPMWVSIFAILILALLWRAWEAMLIGLLMDMVWLPLGALPIFTIGAIFIVWVLEPIRKEFLVR